MELSRPDSTLRHTLEAVLGIPFSNGNHVAVLRNGDEIFPDMLDAIRRAEQTVELLTFIYWTGNVAKEFAAALSDKAAEGVVVRVLLDGVGARRMSWRLLRKMREAGVEVRWFRPVPGWRIWRLDNRTHRKVLVVDGHVGFTGGVGIAREWEGDARNPKEWRDTHFRIEGPAVAGLRASFWGNWMEVEHTIEDAVNDPELPTGSGNAAIQVVRSTASIGWSDIAMMLQALVCSSRRRIRIATAYLAPDAVTAGQLCSAAERGVDVEIMIPGRYIDNRISELAAAEQFEPLLKAGVRMWRYHKTMMHTKVMLVDSDIACIGSANFNQRSMRKDDELSLVVQDRELVRTLDVHFDEDLQSCEPVTLKKWHRRGPVRRLRELVARPFKRET